MRTDRLVTPVLLVVALAVPLHAWCGEAADGEIVTVAPPAPPLPPLPPPPAPLFDLFERAKAAVVTVRAQDIEALGVAVVDGTLVLTAAHVVTNTAWVEVVSGEQVRQARVLYYEDSESPVAVLGLDTPLEYVAPLEISGLETRVGQQVWTLTRAAKRGLGGRQIRVRD